MFHPSDEAIDLGPARMTLEIPDFEGEICLEINALPSLTHNSFQNNLI